VKGIVREIPKAGGGVNDTQTGPQAAVGEDSHDLK
jgi:hypothetical protein